MKKGLLLCCAVLACFCFPCAALAGTYDAEEWCPGLWDGVDAGTKELLEQAGVGGVDAEGFLNLSPDRIASVISGIVRGEAASPLRFGAAAVLAVVLTSLGQALLPETGAMRSRCDMAGRLCMAAVLLSGAGQALYESMAAVTATEDFMVLLIPVFTGIIGFSGNPTLAISWGGAVLAFAETVTAFFARYVPAAGALGAAACAAASLSDGNDFSGAAKLIGKAVAAVMGFVACVFTGVLGIRDVVAAAADNVGIKGMKFIVGQSVPILGSAVSDALNSVAAGLTVVRNTVGAFALLALFFINLAPVIRLLLWKFTFLFCAAAGRLLSAGRTAELADSLNSLLSVVLGVICFNCAVFIIALALVIHTAGR